MASSLQDSLTGPKGAIGLRRENSPQHPYPAVDSTTDKLGKMFLSVQ